MAVLDPSTDIGRIRLRVGDYSDLEYLPDEVYQSTLDDNAGNLVASASRIAMYILGILSHQTHRKMGLQLEVWGAEAFKNYKEFLILTVSNPAFMQYSPQPYGVSGTTVHPLIQFQNDWNKNYMNGTDSQNLAFTAALSPNDGSKFGPYGNIATGTGFL